MRRFMKIYTLPVVALVVSMCFAVDGFAKTVKVCSILPTSGPNAATGIGMQNSMKLAVQRIKNSGQMGDIELEYMPLDDASQPSVGVNAALKAAADPDVIACSAHWNSPVALATQDVFYRNNLANLVPAAINWKITAEQKGDQISRISPPDQWQLEMGGRFPVDFFGHKTFYLIDDNTNYGKWLANFMEEYATKAGAKLIGRDSIQVGEKDFTAVLTKAKELDPGFIFFGGVTTESALLRQQMVKLGFDALYYTGSGTMSPKFIEIAGPAADGAYAFFYGKPYTQYPGGQDFIDAYIEANFDKPYETYGLWAYTSMQVLAQAIKRAADKGELTRDAVVRVIREGSFDTAMGPISFPPPGDVKQRVMAYYQVRNGKWIMTHISDADGNISEVDTQAAWELPWQK